MRSINNHIMRIKCPLRLTWNKWHWKENFISFNNIFLYMPLILTYAQFCLLLPECLTNVQIFPIQERNSVRNRVQLAVEQRNIIFYKLHVNLYTLFDSAIPIMQLKNSNTLYWKINKITYPSSIECSTNYMMNIKLLQG